MIQIVYDGKAQAVIMQVGKNGVTKIAYESNYFGDHTENKYVAYCGTEVLIEIYAFPGLMVYHSLDRGTNKAS